MPERLGDSLESNEDVSDRPITYPRPDQWGKEDRHPGGQKRTPEMTGGGSRSVAGVWVGRPSNPRHPYTAFLLGRDGRGLLFIAA
jgi:hypothetical protein